MAFSNAATTDEFGRGLAERDIYPETTPQNASAVSWGAILAGAAAAAALSLILLILGTGLGFSAISPWSHDGISATAFGLSTILWLTFTQLAASGLGGYLAGRLRTKWAAAHPDEVYFRDTAHGFLTWAVATLATAALLTSVIGAIVSGGLQAGAKVAGGAAATAVAATAGGTAALGSEIAKFEGEGGPMSYFVDSLFRRDLNAPVAPSASDTRGGITRESREQSNSASSAEVARIFINSLGAETLPAEDLRYLGQVVSQRTGLTPQEAETRVSDTYASLQAKLSEAKTTAREVADKGRKASAYAALWLVISLLIGAFIASWAATYGGRRRDA
jgi:hypothetical protein